MSWNVIHGDCLGPLDAQMGRGMTWEVVHADCIEAMREMPENSVHAVVCDPPYDLTDVGRKFQGTGGSIDPRTNRERSERRNGGFMGMKWDATGIAFNVATWQAVYRVLKPGGYLIAFGGSRTYHRMVVAIEDAGFVLHPMLGWVQSQGFPKATSLSKRFDAEAGAERETWEVPRNGGPGGRTGHIGQISADRKSGIGIASAPATDLAKQWDGWFYGRQSMKPALEPICMAQKPPQGRMTDNVRQWSTGAVNINATRVGGESTLRTANKRGVLHYGGENHRPHHDLPDEHRTTGHTAGRWPPNLLFSHHPSCVPLGERRVKSDGHYPAKRGESGYQGGWGGQDGLSESYTNGETVTAWQCHESCPVRLLGEQSGERTSGKGGGRSWGASPGAHEGWRRPAHEHYQNKPKDSFYGDTGTAARFFPVFAPEYDMPLIYQAKASRRERNAGLEGMPERSVDDWPQSLDGNDKRRATPRQNHHPTVKPVALLRWLCRLVTPPGGLVLDCFAGSGSTGMAALLEGFSFVGVDSDPEYVEIARRRIAHVERHGERWLTAKATPVPAPAALPEPSQPTTMQQTMFPLEEAS